MGILQELHIVQGKELKAATIFENLFKDNFMDFPQMAPSEYVKMYWEAYQKSLIVLSGRADSLYF